MSHTPGPWSVDQLGIVNSPNGVVIAQIYDNCDNGTDALGKEQGDYNESLIAAAPELLEALEEVATKTEGGFTFCAFCNYTSEAGHAAHCKVGKAISKAKGVA